MSFKDRKFFQQNFCKAEQLRHNCPALPAFIAAMQAYVLYRPSFTPRFA
jgi:hypothetical protein